MRTLTEAGFYYDSSSNPTGLACRVRFDDGHEETGPAEGIDDLLLAYPDLEALVATHGGNFGDGFVIFSGTALEHPSLFWKHWDHP
jgi:hypothetical protein